MNKRGIQLLEKLDLNLRAIHWRYYHAISAFYVHDTLKKLKSTAHAGKKQAHINVDTINTYKEFILTADEATRIYFILELAKIFDRNNSSLSIWYVLEKVENQLNLITPETLNEYSLSKGGQEIGNLLTYFKPITSRDLMIMRRSFQRAGEILERLKDYRDEWLAHDDLKKSEIKITRGEFMRLFNLVEKYLNLLSAGIHFSSTSYSRVKPDHIRTTKYLIKTLILGNEEYKRIITEKFRKKY